MVKAWEKFESVWKKYKQENPELLCVDCSYGPFCGGVCYDDNGICERPELECNHILPNIPPIDWDL